MTVAVAGLGPAGLHCAHLLQKAGIRVVALEARDRPGGRLHTIVRDDGLCYEAGGEWIDLEHSRCIQLLQEFGLSALAVGNPPRWVHCKGEWSRTDALWSDAEGDMECVEQAATRLAQLPQDELPKECLQQSVADFTQEHCRTHRGLWWVTARLRSDEGDDLDRVGLAGWLQAWRNYIGRPAGAMSAYRFQGGASQLMQRMAESLKPEAVFGCTVRAIVQRPEGVLLRTNLQNFACDAAILCMPPSALRRIRFEPKLPIEKQDAIDRCPMTRTIKLNWRFRSPWWKERDWSGSLHCDSVIQQIWDSSLGDVPSLTAYVCGNDAEELLRSGAPTCVGLESLAALFPEAKDQVLDASLHDWTADELAGGGFTCLPPGDSGALTHHLRRPLGRLHFAGEHTASWIGFIEGAFESAERAVQEVVKGATR